MNNAVATEKKRALFPRLTESDLERYISEKRALGLSEASAEKYRYYLTNFLKWLPTDKKITKERLIAWRKHLEYSALKKCTVEKYVTHVNSYLRYCGFEDFTVRKSNALNLRNKTFGYLTAIEPTQKRYRQEVIWKCRCKCGKEVEVIANCLTSGNTSSCGCINVDVLRRARKYIDGTDLFSSLNEEATSENNKSGYKGVNFKGDKWTATVTYKKTTYFLGSFSKKEDAISARARAKELIKEDAERLKEEYIKLYGDEPINKKTLFGEKDI